MGIVEGKHHTKGIENILNKFTAENVLYKNNIYDHSGMRQQQIELEKKLPRMNYS